VESSRFPTLIFAVGASATVVSFVAPLLFGLSASSRHDTAEKAGTFAADYTSLRSDYDSARTRYYVSYAVPAVVAIVTTVVVILAMPGPNRRKE
jgi:hypothetical protein